MIKENVHMTCSVVTVCYNASKLLEKTILSVIGQTSKSIDYVIIDGGSSDGSKDIIEKYKDRINYYVSEPDQGIYDAMNKGINAATGDYLIFLNVGDVLCQADVLEKVEKYIKSSGSKYDVIYGDVIYKYAFGNKHVASKNLKWIKYDMVFSHQSVFVKTEILKKRLFNLNYHLAADYDFLLWAYVKKLSFANIGMPISVIDAGGGATYDNFVKSRKESYIAQCSYGGNKLLCFCWFLWKVSFFKISSSIKEMFPHSVLKILFASKYARR